MLLIRTLGEEGKEDFFKPMIYCQEGDSKPPIIGLKKKKKKLEVIPDEGTFIIILARKSLVEEQGGRGRGGWGWGGVVWMCVSVFVYFCLSV